MQYAHNASMKMTLRIMAVNYTDLYSHQILLMVIKIFLQFRHNSIG